jgi:putative FmdB family regulatory protein
MPIYEYRCSECQHKLEALQKFSDAPLTVCPKCGQPALRKLVSAAAFQLRGNGWYQTDFRGNGGAKPEKPDEKAAEGGSKSADAPAKTETTAAPDKPATPAPASSSST